MRTCAIVNAMAGREEDLSRVVSLIRTHRSLGDVEVRLVHGPGDATGLAREAATSGFDLLISAGGDGTLNAVVNGLWTEARPPILAVIPLGTGNDFARSVGMPLDLEDALEAVSGATARRIDLVRVSGDGEERCFANASAGGFSGDVGEEMTPEMKESWGPLAYVRSALTTFPESEDYTTRVRFDDEEAVELEVFNLVVANGRTVAGGIPVAPDALLDDGLLDVVVISAAELRRLAGLAPRILVGRHLDHDLVTSRRARSVEVQSRPRMLFNVDGELVGRQPLRYEVLGGALTVLVGSEKGAAFADGPAL